MTSLIALAAMQLITAQATEAPRAAPAAAEQLELSGYVQPRFVVHSGSRHGLDDGGGPAVKDGFAVRRGRLKGTHEGAWSRLVLQIDATPSGVKLKDAEAWLFEPWTGQRLALVAGQTKWPFGYEVRQSSSAREFPERTRVVRAFAAGERDRGAKIAGKLGVVVLSGGVFDGNGTETEIGGSGVVGRDNDRFKDLVGRLGVDLEVVSGGISGWHGRTRRPAELGLARQDFDRQRIGADVQLRLELLPLGRTELRGELIRGTTWTTGGVEQFGKEGQGYYVLFVQRMLGRAALALRYDWFDGDIDTGDVADPTNLDKPASANAVATGGIAALYQIDDAYEVTVAYERVVTGTAASAVDPDDDLFTVQLQAKF